MLVLAKSTAPASRSLRAAVASRASASGANAKSALDPAVVGAPGTTKLSFTATGAPSRRESGGEPAARRAVARGRVRLRAREDAADERVEAARAFAARDRGGEEIARGARAGAQRRGRVRERRDARGDAGRGRGAHRGRGGRARRRPAVRVEPRRAAASTDRRGGAGSRSRSGALRHRDLARGARPRFFAPSTSGARQHLASPPSRPPHHFHLASRSSRGGLDPRDAGPIARLVRVGSRLSPGAALALPSSRRARSRDGHRRPPRRPRDGRGVRPAPRGRRRREPRAFVPGPPAPMDRAPRRARDAYRGRPRHPRDARGGAR